MKYTKSNPPLVCMQTNSTCYKGTYPMQIKGVLWHSTGANNPNIKRYVQPSDNDINKTKLLEIIGTNGNKNDWNHIERQAGLNAWVGKLADGTVSCVQTMPWNYRPWGCYKGNLGSCNNGWIQFEICEDSLSDASYFKKVYQEACELTAYLCTLYNLNPYGTTTCDRANNVPIILCHQDSYQLGLGSNHGDIYHWFSRYGKDMNDVRDDVAELMGIEKQKQPTIHKDTTLRYGSEGPAVKELQTNLIKLKYDCGSAGADGDFGSGTEAAVRAFQKDHGLTIDGIVGTATQEAIKKAIQELEAPKFNTLRKGDDGAEVKAMQLKLLKAGYYIGPYGADSDYGENTELAVRLLQKDSNLTVDGVFGKQTSEALDLAVSNAAAANKAIVNKIKLIQTPPKCTKDLAIKYAKQELGNLEKDSLKDLNSKTSNAGDNNYTKYAQEADAIGLYNALVQGQPWCATWVDNVFIHAYGLNKGCAMKYMPTTKSKSAACNEAAVYYQKANKWFDTPEIGDQVFFKSAKYNYAHTGLVIDIKDNKVITIEGNTSSKAGVVENGGAVEQKEYPLNYSNFKGFGRPDYDEEIQEQEPIEDKSYMVRITAVALNVRSGPGTNYPVVKVLREGGNSFTIVDEKNGFGLLKSGIGWIMLQHTERVI